MQSKYMTLVGHFLTLATLAACGSTEVAFDAGPQALSIDVVVGDKHLEIRANGTDQVCDCDDEMLHFASVGMCLAIDDIVSCRCDPTSCLAASVTGTGVVPPSQPGFPYRWFALPSPLPSDVVLELSGCGHPALAVPIEPYVAPIATVSVDVADQQLIAHWQTGTPATSAYVYFNFSAWAHECHTTAHERSYGWTGLPASSYRNVDVRAFLPVLEYGGRAREVRVWRGGLTSYPNPML